MSATAQPALSSPKLILIVDDTPINLGVISGALKDYHGQQDDITLLLFDFKRP